MSARDKERLYWLKLDRDFFRRNDMILLEGRPGGRDYALLYLKLMVTAIDNNGALFYSDHQPYTAEMISAFTGMPVETVDRALEVFQQLELMQKAEDGTFFFPAVPRLTGSETYAAIRKRDYRAEKRGTIRGHCPQDKDKE